MMQLPFRLNTVDQLKTFAKRVLPGSTYERGSRCWQEVRWRGRSLTIRARLGAPEVLIYFGAAPGDDLMCTAVLRELRQRGKRKVWMMSNHPDLFEGNEDVERVVPVDPFYNRYVSFWRKQYQHLEYAATDREADRSTPTVRHVIAELCLRAGITGSVALRPYLFLTDEERARFSWASGKIAIQSSALAARFPIQNKEWFPERFQEVVGQLRAQFQFVQIGALTDRLLTGVTDMRGRTSKRETAAILANSRVFVGLEGFVMHLARAVECPAVIVFGGRTAPWQFGYSCNVNLYSPAPCAPCWLWNTCPLDRMCMKKISPASVVEATHSQLSKPRDPLAVD